MSENFKWLCMPIRTEKEGIDIAEDVIGAMVWNKEDGRINAWPYDSDNPITIMELSPITVNAQLAEARQDTSIKQRIGLALTEKCDELQKELTEARADIKRLKQVNAELLNLLQASSDLTDEYADHYEHPDNVEEIRDEIKEALEKAKGGKRCKQ